MSIEVQENRAPEAGSLPHGSAPSTNTRRSQWVAYGLLGLFIVLLLGVDVYWIGAHQAPPTWDQAWYLDTSLTFYYALRYNGIISFCKAFSIALSGIKAPLIAVLPIPFYFMLGPSEHVAMLSNLALLIVFNTCLFLLLKGRFGERVALLATVITSSMPMVMLLSHEFLVEYGLGTLVVLWLFFLYRSKAYSLWKYDVILGIVLGLGLLMKVLFPLYIVGPALVMCISRLKQDGAQGLPRLVLAILLIAVIGLLVASPWYVPNLRAVTDFAFSTSFGAIAHDYSLGGIFDGRTIWAYWLTVTNQGLSAFYVLAAVALSLTWCIQKILTRTALHIGRDGWVFASWFGMPLIVATFGVNKDIRYMAPAFPVFGLWVAFLYFRTLGGKWVYRLLPLLLIWPFFGAYYRLTPEGWLNQDIRYKGLIFLEGKQYQSLTTPESPRAEKWPIQEMLAFINEDAQGEGAMIRLAIDHRYLNFCTLDYYRSLHGYPLRLGQIAYTPRTQSLDEVYSLIETSQYVIAKTGYQGPEFTNYRNADIRQRLQSSPRFRLLRAFPLPDGSVAEVYRQ